MTHSLAAALVRPAGRLAASAMLCGLIALAPSAARAESGATLQSARAAYDSGEWEEALDLYASILKGGASTHGQRAEAALERSSILWEQGRYAEAKELAEEALKLAEEERLDGAVGRLLVTIGHIETSQGKFSSAKKTFKLCASLSQEGDDAVFAAICRMNIAAIDKLQGSSGGSQAQFERDIAALKSAETPLASGSALSKTAEVFIELGDFSRAIALLDEAHAQFQRAGSEPAMARNHVRLARAYQAAGDDDRARAHLKLAKAPLTKMNNRPALVDVYGLLGKSAELGGDRDGAISSYHKALELAEAIGNPQLTARGHLALCETLIRPLTEGAGPHCDSAASSFTSLKIPVLRVRAEIAQATIHHHHGEFKQARELYLSIIKSLSEELPERQRDAETLAAQRANLCQLDTTLEITGALRSCKASIESLSALDDPERYASHLASSYYNAGFGAQRERQYDEALAYFERASEAFLQAAPKDALRAADSKLRLGTLLSVTSKGEPGSIQAFEAGLKILEEERGESERIMRSQLHQQLLQELVAQEQWQRAEQAALALIALAEQDQDDAAAAHAYNNLAVASLKLRKRPEALEALKKGIAHAEASGQVPEQLKLMRANLKKLE